MIEIWYFLIIRSFIKMERNFLLLGVSLSLLVLSSWATADSKIIYDAFDEGPYFVNHTDFYQLANPTLDHNLGVFAPNEPGNFPVFYFVTGFAGITSYFQIHYKKVFIIYHI